MTPSAAVAPFAGTYAADVDHSFVGFSVLHMGVSTFRASFSDVFASVAVGDDGALKLHGSAQVQSVSILSPPEFRSHVLGADFFDAERHPAIAFESRPAHPAEDGTITVEGSLTVRNVTRDIVATGTWSPPLDDLYGKMRAGIELTTTIDRRDYGMAWNAQLPKGGDALGTRVTLTVHLELIGD